MRSPFLLSDIIDKPIESETSDLEIVKYPLTVDPKIIH